MRLFLLGALCAALAACADLNDNPAPITELCAAGIVDSSPPCPLAYDDSALTEEHRAEFRAAQDIWEEATGIELFDLEGIQFIAYYAPLYPVAQMEWYDIAFRDDFAFSVGCEESGPRQEFRHVSLHELGHAIGLGHSNDPKSVMLQGQTGCLPPSQKDIAVVQSRWD